VEPAAPLGARRKRKSSWQAVLPVAGGFLAVAGLIVGFILFRPQTQKTSAPRVAAPVASAQQPAAADQARTASGVYSRGELETHPELIAEFKPTHGQSIQLLMVPSGVNLVIHMRPALLWGDDYSARLLRASLTDELVNWMSQQITTICHRPPAQIEEVLFGIILGSRGSMPQVCCVVHLKEPEKLSSLIEEFPGRYLYDVVQRPDVRIKVDDRFGYLIHDEQTFAICPVEYAGELENWIKTPNYEVSEGIAQQLKQTDRERLFTLIGTCSDLRIHQTTLVPGPALPALKAVLEWLGEDVETVGWSLHPEPYFHSQVWLRPTSTTDTRSLQDETQSRLAELPVHVWKDLCIKMSPAQVRFRKLIGRLPAMLEAFQRATVSERGGRMVQFTTVLPAKAVPNLALATMFTVNEAARTNFAASAPVVASTATKPKLPETVKERLNILVDAEFSRTPLEQALQYLCDEMQVTLEINGDALKDSGYTKNMPQTFNLGKVPARQAFNEILKNYQDPGKRIVGSINEATKTLLITTSKFAERDNLPMDLP